MGVWGYGPLDNDGAADMLGHSIMSRAPSVFGEGELDLGERDAEVIRESREFLAHPVGWNTVADHDFVRFRAAPYILNSWGILTDEEAQAAVAGLQQVLDEPSWTDSWNDPAALRKAIKGEIAMYKKAGRRARRLSWWPRLFRQ